MTIWQIYARNAFMEFSKTPIIQEIIKFIATIQGINQPR